MGLLEGWQVTKSFGGLRALDEVDFQATEKEILGIIGPNGSGKTTLFNLISGSYPPTSGKIIFGGETISGLKPYEICKKGIARTFQLGKPFLNLTVKENVMVGNIFGCGNREKKRHNGVAEVLELLNLTEKKEKLAKELTMAERKRLEIARALAANPRVILLDEVMAGLTPKEVEQAVQVIRKIFARQIAVILIEHVMSAVAELCQRIVVLSYGKKIAEGTPGEIAKHEEVVKAYLGKRRLLG